MNFTRYNYITRTTEHTSHVPPSQYILHITVFDMPTQTPHHTYYWLEKSLWHKNKTWTPHGKYLNCRHTINKCMHMVTYPKTRIWKSICVILIIFSFDILLSFIRMKLELEKQTAIHIRFVFTFSSSYWVWNLSCKNKMRTRNMHNDSFTCRVSNERQIKTKLRSMCVLDPMFIFCVHLM